MDINDKIKAWEWLNGFGSTPYRVRVDGESAIEIVGLPNAAAEINSMTQEQIDAYHAAQSAEIDSLQSDLVTAINDAFGVMPPYSATVAANYRTILRNQMRQARADVEAATTLAQLRDAQKALNQRQQIINIVREIEALDGSWTIGDVGR